MNAKMFGRVVLAAAIAALCVSCASESKRLIKKGMYDCSTRLQTARERMDKRNYTNALRVLKEIEYQCGGGPQMDTVYYLSATANFKLKQYTEARDDFESLYREFPRSPFVEEAYFRIGHMRYMQSLPFFRDQADTREALRLIGDYVDLFPNGVYTDSARTLLKTSIDKLAEKEFNNARFYRRQKEHEAALIYYRSLLSDYPESKFAPDAVISMAEMLVELGRTQDAQDVIGEIDAAAFDEKLKERIIIVKQKLGVNG